MKETFKDLVKNFAEGIELSAIDTMYPSRLTCLKQGPHLFENITSQFYGVVLSGEASIDFASGGGTTLLSGMYFSLCGNDKIDVRGKVVVFERFGYRGLRQIGGPAEQEGRLTYIDGCRSTVLVHPARIGDPVLNLLVFPANVEQTTHVHPTTRLGVVLSGGGVCLVEGQSLDLQTGKVFYLPENSRHSFNSNHEGLRIVAFHPDSDTGPTDGNNPMLNRTYIRRE